MTVLAEMEALERFGPWLPLLTLNTLAHTDIDIVHPSAHVYLDLGHITTKLSEIIQDSRDLARSLFRRKRKGIFLMGSFLHL